MLEYKKWYEGKRKDFVSVFQSIQKQRKSQSVGFYDLPVCQKTLIEQIERFKKQNTLIKANRLKDLVVVGIGGSSLGTRAVDDLLRFSQNRNIRNIHFLENLDPIFLIDMLKQIEFDKALFLVVSKSGSTVETISLAKYLVDFVKKRSLIQEYKDHVAIISDAGSPLHSFAKKHGLEFFSIPANVGGRFSVLSSVGLVPLSLLGYDIKALLSGAGRLKEEFFTQQGRHPIFEKAHFLCTNGANINVLFSYSSLFESFNKWYVQLWGESLGKIDSAGNRVGLTPAGLIGSIDQHSFLQLITQGPKDKTVTFIKLKHFDIAINIPRRSFEFLSKTDFVNGQSFQTVINAQCDATMQSVIEQDVPTDLIEMKRLDEASVGYLLYYFQLLTAVSGEILQINAFDQPGVEAGKQKLKEILTQKNKGE
ncbi:MAG: glucose-6-phosphate isomerase [Campylobacterota bacterium]